MLKILQKLRKLAKFNTKTKDYAGEGVLMEVKRKVPIGLTDDEIDRIGESVKCIRVIDGCLRIYGENKTELIAYRATITEVKDYLGECGLMDHFFFHRSFILNLNVFDDEIFSRLIKKRLNMILQKWDLKLTSALVYDLKEKIRIYRKM